MWNVSKALRNQRFLLYYLELNLRDSLVTRFFFFFFFFFNNNKSHKVYLVELKLSTKAGFGLR